MHLLAATATGMRKFLILVIWLSAAWAVTADAQEIDGLVHEPQSLLGKPAIIQPTRGALIEGELAALQPSRAGENDVQFVEVVSNGRPRNQRKSNCNDAGR